MNTPLFFDTHSHLNFPQYEKDGEEIIGQMKEEKIWTICVGTDLKTSSQSVELAKQHEHILATIGIHPTDWRDGFEEKDYEQIDSIENVVGVGECGLDYFRDNDDVTKNGQKKLFEEQINFAINKNLPLMLHCRPSRGKMDAYEEALIILESYAKNYGEKLRGNSHFFVGTEEIAKRFLNIGFTIAFPGVITFAREYDNSVKYIPKDMLLSETDAPFATPEPYRGERNNPLYVVEIVKALSRIRGENEEKLKKQLVSNALRVFSKRPK